MPTLTERKQLSSCEPTEVRLKKQKRWYETAIPSTSKKKLDVRAGGSWLQGVKVRVSGKVNQKWLPVAADSACWCYVPAAASHPLSSHRGVFNPLRVAAVKSGPKWDWWTGPRESFTTQKCWFIAQLVYELRRALLDCFHNASLSFHYISKRTCCTCLIHYTYLFSDYILCIVI